MTETSGAPTGMGGRASRCSPDPRSQILVLALQQIRDGFDGDEFQDPADAYDQHREIAREALAALAAYEQEQKP